jgi:hypothetical protein
MPEKSLYEINANTCSERWDIGFCFWKLIFQYIVGDS